MAFVLTNSVFIHIPKTAGQWVSAVLEHNKLITQTLGVVHASPDEIDDDPIYLSMSEVFAFVRHPLNWYQSMWAHQMDDQWEPIDADEWFTSRWLDFWQEFTQTSQSDDFQIFVRNCLDHYPDGLVSGLYTKYTAGCSFVGKQEHLADDLCTVLTRAGERYELDKIKNTKSRNVRGQKAHRRSRTAYSRDLIRSVMAVEGDAIDRYDYQKVPADIGIST